MDKQLFVQITPDFGGRHKGLNLIIVIDYICDAGWYNLFNLLFLTCGT